LTAEELKEFCIQPFRTRGFAQPIDDSGSAETRAVHALKFAQEGHEIITFKARLIGVVSLP
jgi:hypothetical protein